MSDQPTVASTYPGCIDCGNSLFSLSAREVVYAAVFSNSKNGHSDESKLCACFSTVFMEATDQVDQRVAPVSNEELEASPDEKSPLSIFDRTNSLTSNGTA